MEPDRVALAVARDENALRVSWPILPGADHGLLQIKDGKQQSQLHLDAVELRSGLLTYWPESPEVTFNLDIMAGSRKWSGTIRAADGNAGSQSEPSPFASSSAGKPKLIRNARMEQPAPPQTPILTPISLRPQVAVVAEPVRRRGVLSRIPLLRKLEKSPQAFVPPRPLHQERPPLGGLEEGESTRSLGVDVQVKVSETGTVKSAKLVSEVEAADETLATGALSAARRWKFAPASLDGENVPGEVILHFRFEPGR
jgi:TonB family protein